MKFLTKKGIAELAILGYVVGTLITGAVVQKVVDGGPKRGKAAMRKCVGYDGSIKNPLFKAKVDSCRVFVASMDYAATEVYLQ